MLYVLLKVPLHLRQDKGLVIHGPHGGQDPVQMIVFMLEQLGEIALQLHLHPGGGVFYIAFQAAVLHQLVDKGAKSHALHYSLNMYPDSLQADNSRG